MKTDKIFHKKKLFYVIKDDLKANKGNLKIIIILLFFRLSASIRNSNIFIKIIFIWIRLIYKVCIQWGYGIDFPDNTQAGSPIINVPWNRFGDKF